MKKLFFFILLCIGLTSCNEPTITKSKSIPIEVKSLIDTQKFDTIIIVNSTDKCYIINKDNSIQEFNNTDESGYLFIIGFIIGIGLTIIVLL